MLFLLPRGIFDGRGNQHWSVTIDEDLPVEFEVDTAIFAQFLRQDLDPSVTFYGGELLLRTDLSAVVMDQVPEVKYSLHTNGTLLDELPTSVVNRLDAISVSFDGMVKDTDAHRGTGTYRKIMKNLQDITSRGFDGELIARMTVTEGMNIQQAVTHLATNSNYAFSSVQWQLDATFSGFKGGEYFHR